MDENSIKYIFHTLIAENVQTIIIPGLRPCREVCQTRSVPDFADFADDLD